MDGWTDGQKCGWIDGCVWPDGWMDRWMDRQMKWQTRRLELCSLGWTEVWMDRWMCMDRQMDGQTDEMADEKVGTTFTYSPVQGITVSAEMQHLSIKVFGTISPEKNSRYYRICRKKSCSKTMICHLTRMTRT